jgi:general secretion pathway protein D
MKQLFRMCTVVMACAAALEGVAQAPNPMPGLPPGMTVPPAPPSTTPPSPGGRAVGPAGGSISLPTRATSPGGSGLRLKFNNAPLDIVLQDYSEHTKRTLLLAPNLPKASITLQSQGDLSMDEYLQAVETVLSMNGIALLKEGEKFLRVVSIDKARGEPMPIRSFDDAEKVKDSGELISQMIPLKNIEPGDAQKAIEPLKHTFGQIHVFEQINSIMVTDTSANVNRIMEIIKYIDQAVEAREEPIIIEIKYAKAADIKSKLEEIIAEQQKGGKPSTVPEQRMQGSPGVVTPATPAMGGIIRGRVPTPGQAVETSAEVQAKAERGVISGTVKIVADERTNILIIITRRENMTFFEKVIKVLDVETTPEVIVKVMRLEYAQAKDVEGMLNDLIGAVSSQKEDGNKGSKLPSRSAEGADQREGTPLRQYAEKRETSTSTPSPASAATGASGAQPGSGKSKLGQLSKDNIKILSDERTNALILMASKSDMAMLEEIIKGMDVMISQVLIEAAVLDIQLDDTLKTGFDWVQRSMITYQNGASGRSPLFSFAGGGGSGSGDSPMDATSLTRASSLQGGPGLTYYFTHFGLNMDAVLTMVQTDSRAKVLASPVILTHDNTEAVVDASQERYFYKGQRYVGGGVSGNYGMYEPDVERRKVGLHMKVKPHINEKRFVLMEVSQQIEELGPDQQIGTDKWPTVLSREMSASIAVQSRETIVLGGLVRRSEKESRSGIPFLYRIPLLGLLFRGSDSAKTADELIVFMTPYVLNTPEEILSESARRKSSLDMGNFWKQGWTESALAEPMKRTKDQIETERRIRERLEAQGFLTPEATNAAPQSVQPAAAAPAKAVDPSMIERLNSLESRWSNSLQRVSERESQAAAKKP